MPKKRYFVFVIFAFAAMLFITARFFYFSVLKNDFFTSLATTQQTASTKIRSLRGNIYDRNMIKLTNRISSDMYLSSEGKITALKTPYAFRDTVRYSPCASACHIIGHTDSDSNGIAGIEKAFDSYLRSDSFSKVSYFSDATGSPRGELKKISPRSTAADVVLTLDSHIQKIVADALKKHITTGAAVVLDTTSFDLLACVSLPEYEASSVESYMNSQQGELLNRALMAYDAGSVFKTVTSAAAFSKNPLYHNRLFWCNGAFSPDNSRHFECHKKDGHGLITMQEAFAQSCNCAFYETGLCTGASDICTMARAFGFGEKVLNTDIGESCGNIPQKLAYSNYETLNLSIGQGEILITPLQCTLMCATVANNGLRKQVNLVSSVISPDNSCNNSFYDVSTSRSISPQIAELIAAMMREAVVGGTASSAMQSSVTIAGKTGSAQTGWLNSDGTYKVHGWFCGFFPYENPRYAMTVFCEDGKSGALSCVDPFVEIAENIMRIYPVRE